MLEKALPLLKVIEEHGYTALIVGGAVRDYLLKRPIRDIDLATDMPINLIKKHFTHKEMGRSRQFSTLSIVFAGTRFEISSLSSPGVSGHISREDSDQKQLFLCDARRRDFSINAMAMDQEKKIIDPFGGLSDLNKQVIRGTYDPEQRFAEDPLRVLRAVRLAVSLGFSIEDQTFKSMDRHCRALAHVAPERIGSEIISIFSLPGKDGARAVSLMDQTGLLEQVLPEIYALKLFKHNPKHHPEGGVFEHTLAALSLNESGHAAVNLSILFHDAGKSETMFMKNGHPVYHGHEKAAEKIIRNAGKRLMFPNKLISSMCFAALNHMLGLRINDLRPSRAFKLISHPDWPVLEAVLKCDAGSRGKQKARRFEQDLEQTRQRLQHWFQPGDNRPLPAITGRQVMEYTGLPQGPVIGKILRQTNQWAVDNNISDPDLIRQYVMNI